MKNQSASKNFRACTARAIGILACVLATPTVFAASQTWTNAPADATWANTNNWVGRTVPGAFVPGGSTQNGDFATFNSPLSAGLGGVGNPILIDISGTTNREVGGFLFDTANCGAYVIGSPGGNNLELTAAYNSTTIGSNITVTATVVNPITFSGPVHFHYASSANGGYQFTNNSAIPSATLSFNMITNDSASSRPLTLTLAGSNTGTNTIAHFDDNAGANGSIHLVKAGTGRWVFTGPNDFPQKKSGGDNINASIAVVGGTLEVKDPGSLGAITEANLIVGGTGTLLVDGVTLNNTGITLTNGGTVQMNGLATINGVALGTVPATSATLATTSSGDVLTLGTAASALTGGASDTLLHISGPGTVLLGQSANYVGQYSLDAGTVQLASAAGLGSGGNLNVGAGGILDLTPLGSGITYTLTTAALSAGGTGTAVGTTAATIKADLAGAIDLATSQQPISLAFDPTAFTGDLTHPALYISQGTLSLKGNTITVNNISGTPLGAGTYQLVSQANGNISYAGGAAAIVSGSGLVSGAVGSIQVTGGEVDLVVVIYASKNLTWKGGDPDDTWDINTSANWLNGGAPSVFNISDMVQFDPTGSAYPTINLSGTLVPGGVTVDTSANNYTFGGSGVIAGATSLVKINSGTLQLQTANTYAGGTVISNGIIQLGVNNAIPDTGAGDVTLFSPGGIDLNGYSDSINALNGSGTLDTVSGGAPVLTVGVNGDSGTFSGIIQNTSGTLGITKSGNGVEVLSADNSYSGPTTINAGTLRIANYGALGGGSSPVTLNGGTLDLATNIIVDSLSGSAGTIANNTTLTTNTITVTNTSTYGGIIAKSSGAGAVAVYVASGSLQLNGANTYAGGTIVASGATFAVGNASPTAEAGTGPIIASNNATISLPGTSSGSANVGNPMTTVAGATVSFTSASTANEFSGQNSGGPTSTNIYTGSLTLGGVMSFSNFTGTVIFTNALAGTRFYASPFGGDNTTFDLVNNGTCVDRGGDIIRLGALFGDPNTSIGNPSVGPASTYWIGAKGVDSTFSGSFTGSNSLVKLGAGTLTLNGGLSASTTLNGDGSTSTNLVYTNGVVAYSGTTIISNGVLALDAPIILTNSYNGNAPTPVILASAAAVLDATSMGYVSNQYDSDGVTVTNQVLVTNGIFEVIANQAFSGAGTLRGVLQMDSGSTLNVGNVTGSITNGSGTGVLTVTGTANLDGAVNLRLNNTNAVNGDQLAAPAFAISGATLLITNVGPALAGGNVFHLFSAAIDTNGFTSIKLPTVNSPLSISNNLAVDGTLVILSPVSTNAFAITNVFNGGNLTLSWPSDHIGWRLQVQTNSLAVGISNNWSDWPGSTNVGSESIPVNTGNGAVFFRMVYP